MKKVLKLLGLLIVLVVAGTLVYLSMGQYKADSKAVSYTENNGEYLDGYVKFDHNSDNGLIFFTGAKVEPEAYSYLNEVSDANIYIVDSPFNFAMGNADAATEIIEAESDVTNWYVGGHSLGGVVASMYAEDNVDTISGVVLLGSYPQAEVTSDMKYLSIYGSVDGLVGDYTENKKLFNEENSTFIEVEGGNHSQFGNYGFQEGDNPSTTTSVEQQQIIVDSITEFIK